MEFNSRGGVGCISVTANVAAKLCSEFQDASLKKEDKEFIDLLNAYQKIENGSKMWGMFTDFNFYSLEPHRALYIEGFGKAYQKEYKNDK